MSQSLNNTSSLTLSAVLCGLVIYHLMEAATVRKLSIQMNSCLHALMSASMAAMVLGLGWPLLPQLIIFALAAHWFVVQAVSRVEYLRCSTSDRLKCIYYAAAMAAAGLMLLPLGPTPTAYTALPPAHHHSILTGSKTLIPESVYEIGIGVFVAAAIVFSLSAFRSAFRRFHKRTEGVVIAPRRFLASATEIVSAVSMAIMLNVMT